MYIDIVVIYHYWGDMTPFINFDGDHKLLAPCYIRSFVCLPSWYCDVFILYQGGFSYLCMFWDWRNVKAWCRYTTCRCLTFVYLCYVYIVYLHLPICHSYSVFLRSALFFLPCRLYPRFKLSKAWYAAAKFLYPTTHHEHHWHRYLSHYTHPQLATYNVDLRNVSLC